MNQLLRRLLLAAPFQPATNYWRSIELPVLAQVLPPTGRGLDVGCGDGELTRILKELTGGQWQLVGVDPDPAETAHAARLGLYERLHTTTADRIAEPAESFDFAFSNSVLEHIPNAADCLREMGRLLRPGGLMAATVPSPSFHKLLKGPGLLRRLSRDEYLHEIDRRLAHDHYWPTERWQQELAAGGFESSTFHGYLSRRQTRRWETWSNWTGGLLYRLKRKREQPIAIQRTLGLRRTLPKPLAPLVIPLAWAISLGTAGHDSPCIQDNACLLVTARKARSAH